MSRFDTKRQTIRETVTFEIDDLLVDGRWVSAEIKADIRHTPAERHRASLCYYDSPPDPAETSVEAVSVVAWRETDEDGEELCKVLTGQQIAQAAIAEIEQRAEDRYI